MRIFFCKYGCMNLIYKLRRGEFLRVWFRRQKVNIVAEDKILDRFNFVSMYHTNINSKKYCGN